MSVIHATSSALELMLFILYTFAKHTHTNNISNCFDVLMDESENMVFFCVLSNVYILLSYVYLNKVVSDCEGYYSG